MINTMPVIYLFVSSLYGYKPLAFIPTNNFYQVYGVDSPLNSYLYVHWILDFKQLLLLL